MKFALRWYAGDAETGGGRMVYLATSEEVEGATGKYFVDNKEAEATDDARNMEYAKVLWEKSLNGGGWISRCFHGALLMLHAIDC